MTINDIKQATSFLDSASSESFGRWLSPDAIFDIFSIQIALILITVIGVYFVYKAGWASDSSVRHFLRLAVIIFGVVSLPVGGYGVYSIHAPIDTGDHPQYRQALNVVYEAHGWDRVESDKLSHITLSNASRHGDEFVQQAEALSQKLEYIGNNDSGQVDLVRVTRSSID